MRVAFYVRVSTDNQTVQNQLQDLRQVADRLSWDVVHIFEDQGISGAKGRAERPGLDELMKAITRREINLIAAWSVCRLGRSLTDLVSFLADINARGVDLYLHKQGLDTSTPSGRMMFQMLSVFSEFERAMISERVKAGLARSDKKLGRPTTSDWKQNRIRKQLGLGKGVREVARMVCVSPATVSRIKNQMKISEVA